MQQFDRTLTTKDAVDAAWAKLCADMSTATRSAAEAPVADRPARMEAVYTVLRRMNAFSSFYAAKQSELE
jgi:hypothetical protein